MASLKIAMAITSIVTSGSQQLIKLPKLGEYVKENDC